MLLIVLRKPVCKSILGLQPNNFFALVISPNRCIFSPCLYLIFPNSGFPDLIILDVWLGKSEFDGIQLLSKFKDLNPLNTVGYKELFEHFKGNLTKSQAIEKIKQNTRRYAKRQMTWLKNKNLIWIENNVEIDEIKRFINSNNL